MSQEPHKIEVFPAKHENEAIDFAKTENYLKEVKNRLNLVKVCGGQDENILFNDALLLAMVVQKLCNEKIASGIKE